GLTALRGAVGEACGQLEARPPQLGMSDDDAQLIGLPWLEALGRAFDGEGAAVVQRVVRVTGAAVGLVEAARVRRRRAVQVRTPRYGRGGEERRHGAEGEARKRTPRPRHCAGLHRLQRMVARPMLSVSVPNQNELDGECQYMWRTAPAPLGTGVMPTNFSDFGTQQTYWFGCSPVSTSQMRPWPSMPIAYGRDCEADGACHAFAAPVLGSSRPR